MPSSKGRMSDNPKEPQGFNPFDLFSGLFGQQGQEEEQGGQKQRGGIGFSMSVSFGGMKLGFEARSGHKDHEDKRQAFNMQFGMDFSAGLGNFGFSFYQGQHGQQGDSSQSQRGGDTEHQRSGSQPSSSAKFTSQMGDQGGNVYSAKFKREDEHGNKQSVKYTANTETGDRTKTFKQSHGQNKASMSLSKNDQTGDRSISFSKRNEHESASMSFSRNEKTGDSGFSFSHKNKDRAMDFSMNRSGNSTSINLNLKVGSFKDIFSGLKDAHNMYKSAKNAEKHLMGHNSATEPRNATGKRLPSKQKALPAP